MSVHILKLKHTFNICCKPIALGAKRQQLGTTVFVTFIDASKAFDKINYWLLFQ